MTYELSEFDFGEISDEQLQPILEATNLLEREADPHATDMTADELRMFATSPMEKRQAVVVKTDTGDVVGFGGWTYSTDGSSPNVLESHIKVIPQHRRRGVGTMMLAYMTDAAEKLGRRTLQSWHHDTVPAGGAFAEAIGAKTGEFSFQRNVVPIADIDRSMMDEWSRIGETTAPGYSVRLYEGVLPQELLEDIAYLHRILDQDAPFPAEMEPREWTAERYDEMQQHYSKQSDALSALAFHDETGRAVGMSQLVRSATDPTIWLVTVTMVDREHRGHRLGKWVKGTVNVAAFERWKGGVYQETNNAFTNEAMVTINREMGFKHERSMIYASMTVADARTYLAKRT